MAFSLSLLTHESCATSTSTTLLHKSWQYHTIHKTSHSARRFIHVQNLFDYLSQYVYSVICRSLHDMPICPVRWYKEFHDLVSLKIEQGFPLLPCCWPSGYWLLHDCSVGMIRKGKCYLEFWNQATYIILNWLLPSDMASGLASLYCPTTASVIWAPTLHWFWQTNLK